MKTYFKIIILALTVLMFNACEKDYIDPINSVAPGPDEDAPVVTVKYPVDGTQIQVPELVASINIQFEVTDDIEIANISVLIDGVEIASYNEFKDYRRAVEELVYDNVTNGDHTLTVTAIDLENKTTTVTRNFSKAPPYSPIYPDEIFYMPFDNDYMEMISFANATVVGNPGFAGESIIQGEGVNAYAGAADSYLSFSTEGLLTNQLTAVFWMKINAVPDRAGILVVGAPDDANPTAPNNRKHGFRFFRENASGNQRFKLNVGTGESDSWFDGGAAADVDPTTNEWVHMAFTISETEAVVYINGQVVKQGELAGVDWTGCDVISIMSGAPRFTGWTHLSDNSFMDELRLFKRALSQDEIINIIESESGKTVGYNPKYDGEIFYMPFEDDNKEYVSGMDANMVGTTGFSDDGKLGKAFLGATDSYLTFPTDGLKNDNFSAVFWYKANATPDRAGILVMGPEDPDNADYPEKQNNRKSGFRFFREAAGTNQIFKLNAGNGEADSWFDGGADAQIDPATGAWVHMAFTISGTECVFYIDGEVAKQGEFSGIDWTGCDILTIGSGAPRFTGWDHKSDLSLMDELRIFDKALTQEEVQAIIADEN